MDEPGNSQDKAQRAPGQTPPPLGDILQERKAPSPEQKSGTPSPPRTYTEAEAHQMVNEALMQRGREHKVAIDVAVRERDGFKTQAEKLPEQYAQLQAERDVLNSQLDELASDDPEKGDLIKLKRALQAQQEKLKADLKALDAARQEQAEAMQVVGDTKLAIAIWEIAAGYQGGDPVKLKEICEVTGASEETQIRKIADQLWLATPAPQEITPLVPDSGQTRGGGVDTSKNTPRENIALGLKQREKARK